MMDIIGTASGGISNLVDFYNSPGCLMLPLLMIPMIVGGLCGMFASRKEPTIKRAAYAFAYAISCLLLFSASMADECAVGYPVNVSDEFAITHFDASNSAQEHQKPGDSVHDFFMAKLGLLGPPIPWTICLIIFLVVGYIIIINKGAEGKFSNEDYLCLISATGIALLICMGAICHTDGTLPVPHGMDLIFHRISWI